jgi:hypothetical protein
MSYCTHAHTPVPLSGTHAKAELAAAALRDPPARALLDALSQASSEMDWTVGDLSMAEFKRTAGADSTNCSQTPSDHNS